MNNVPEKAYKNLEFLNSPAARHIRILCEYEEARQRFLAEGVDSTIVFFGSARTKDRETAKRSLEDARVLVESDPNNEDYQDQLAQAQSGARMAEYYEAARELARRLTEWSMEREPKGQFVITSGGGPGMMEAANRGASEVKDGRSIGLGISLPFETGVNQWVTPELAFEFHYFFTRKYWFLYLCRALVIFPGGFGTLDELFESLTLVQTGKIKRKLPILMFGKDYWEGVLNLDVMAEFGTISKKNLDLIHSTDSVDEAFEYLISVLE